MMKRKICFCIDSLNIGGAERLVIDLINHWQGEWDIYLVTFFETNELSWALNQKNLIKHIKLGANCSRLDAVIKMYKLCVTHKINTTLCHLERPNKWLAIGARLAGTNVVNTVHSINIYNKTSFLRRNSIAILYNLIPHRIIAISDTVKDYLISFKVSSRKIHVVRNGVDVSFLQREYPLTTFSQKLSLVVLARLEPVKAIDILLESLAVFNMSDPLWSLRIIGDGSQRTVLEEQAKRLGIKDKVEFVGAQNKPLRYLQDRNAICMPSHREGLPIALLEALSIGLPAIVSNVGFLPCLVTDNCNGFVCESGSQQSLLTSIQNFSSLTEKQLQDFSCASRKVALQYDIKKCVSNYQAVIENIS